MNLLELYLFLLYHDSEFKEISYQFLNEFWGHGYATEVLKKFLNYCKNVLLLKAIVSETQTANKKSCLLLGRLGYKLKERLIRFEEEQSVYLIEL